MVEIRIKRRLRSLGISSFGQYCDHVFAPEGRENELVNLIDVITTNKTDFFREAGAFRLPRLQGAARPRGAQGLHPEVPRLERRLLHRRGALYASLRPQRIRARVHRFSVQRAGNRHLHRGAGQGRHRNFQVRVAEARAAGPAAKVLHAQSRSAIGPFSGRSRNARPHRISTPQFHGRRLRACRLAGNHLLPQRHHLFRPAHSGQASGKADPATRAGRLLLRRPFRIPSRHGLAAGSRGPRRLQEALMIEPAAILPDLDLQPGELYLARSPAILRTILGSCVGVTFWSSRLGAGALCHGVLPKCPLSWPPGSKNTEGHRYVDFSIRYLARQFDALGACRQRTGSKTIRRRRRASRCRHPRTGPRWAPKTARWRQRYWRRRDSRYAHPTWAECADEEFTSTPVPVKCCSIAWPPGARQIGILRHEQAKNSRPHR